MSRSVDHVERIGSTVDLPWHTYCLGFNGDASFTLNIHAVKVLCLHIARRDNASCLKHTVSERGFSMINMCNNAEVANNRGVGSRRYWRIFRQRSHSHIPFMEVHQAAGTIISYFPIMHAGSANRHGWRAQRIPRRERTDGEPLSLRNAPHTEADIRKVC